MEYEYELTCAVCDVKMTLVVEDNEELPTHCPMCGSPSEDDWER